MKGNKRDITTTDDVTLMVDTFYAHVNKDELLSPIFNDFSKVDWDFHLPKMYSFWNTLIFGKQSYKGNPFAAHIPLPIGGLHFERWLELFKNNIDEHFSGKVAEHTKVRAESIAHIFQRKLQYIKQ